MSRFFPRRALSCALLFLLGISTISLSAVTSLPVQLVNQPPVEVSMESFLDQVPPSGFAPVLVTLRNRTSNPQTFHLAYDSGSSGFGRYSSSYKATGSVSLPVGPGERTQTYVYIPVLSSSNYSDISVRLSGPGIRDGAARIANNYSRNFDFFVGIGEQTNTLYRGLIEKELAAQASGHHGNTELQGTRISPAAAPDDWRAYAAFTSVWLSTAEWNVLPPGSQAAIAEWVGLGGKLYLLHDTVEQRAAFHLPGAQLREDGSFAALGLGGVHLLLFPAGDAAAASQFVARTITKEVTLTSVIQENQNSSSGSVYSRSWGLQRLVPPFSRNVGLLSIFMLAFAVVIGPVNFFVLAPSKRRYRILWTTPAIAVATSLLLFGIILLSDGTGGRGARLTLACLLPEQKRLALTQEQVSRTGLLLGSSFDFPATAQIMPVDIPSENSGNQEATRDATGWSGNWFGSRASQAQLIQTLHTVHGNIKVTLPADGRPGQALVGFEYPLAELYIIAPDGETFYYAQRLAPGVSVPLEEKSLKDFEAWLKPQQNLAGQVLQEKISSAVRPGQFFALAAKPAAIAVPTLNSIEWEDDIVLLTGPAQFSSAQ